MSKFEALKEFYQINFNMKKQMIESMPAGYTDYSAPRRYKALIHTMLFESRYNLNKVCEELGKKELQKPIEKLLNNIENIPYLMFAIYNGKIVKDL